MKEPITHPLKWLRIVPGYYSKLRHLGTTEEKAAVFDELLDCVLEDKKPTIAVNILNMEKSHQAWGDHLEKKEKRSAEMKKKWAETRAELAALKGGGNKSEPEIFKLKGKEHPGIEEVTQFAGSIGAEHGAEWLQWTIDNEWRDSWGKPINNWKRALIAFEKKHNPNFEPAETPQEDIEP